eukprot:2949660-Pleurochrysis_carterae.AAC.2
MVSHFLGLTREDGYAKCNNCPLQTRRCVVHHAGAGFGEEHCGVRSKRSEHGLEWRTGPTRDAMIFALQKKKSLEPSTARHALC